MNLFWEKAVDDRDGYTQTVHTKTRNELEPLGPTWNYLEWDGEPPWTSWEPPETSWNKVDPPNEMDLATNQLTQSNKKFIGRNLRTTAMPDRIQHWKYLSQICHLKYAKNAISDLTLLYTSNKKAKQVS